MIFPACHGGEAAPLPSSPTISSGLLGRVKAFHHPHPISQKQNSDSTLISTATHPAKFTSLFLGYHKKKKYCLDKNISEGLCDSSLSCLLLCVPDASADVPGSAKAAPCLTFPAEEGKSLLAAASQNIRRTMLLLL